RRHTRCYRDWSSDVCSSDLIAVLSCVLRITAAIILLQTLFFKFTGAPESVYIFTKVGAEPWGRIGSGVVELIAAILILTPRFTRSEERRVGKEARMKCVSI